MTTVVIPRAATRPPGVALLGGGRLRVLQSVLFVLGGVLMPLGLAVIGIGWYGAANTPYLYDQVSYLISGGLLGLGLTFTGGFLYFGAWIAVTAANQRDTAQRLADAMLTIADVAARMQHTAARASVLVVAGDGTTVHRNDCPLVAHRADLRPIDGTEPGLTPCRVCQPID